jgi:hypothetical protein
MVAACSTLAAACGLSMAGEKVVTEMSLDGTVTGDADFGDGGNEGSGGDLNNYDGGTFAGDDGSSPGATDSASGTCDFNGTWGSLLEISVSWAPEGLNLQAFILAPGSGMIKQWIKGTRVQRGNSLVDTTFVCGIDLPDFQGTEAVAGQTYGVVFPDSLFDDMYLPSFDVVGTLTAAGPGATYTTSASAALLGLTMANPTTDPWPATVTTSVDSDRDTKPGVTADVAQGGPYSNIPVGIPAPFAPVITADKLYLAIRQVTEVTGTVTDCDHVSGTVTIPQIAGQYAINSHVLGCQLTDGGDCTTSGSSSQASFVDNTQPVFTPSGTTSFASVRLPAGATCATVREMLQ